jgi:hypothetical protein
MACYSIFSQNNNITLLNDKYNSLDLYMEENTWAWKIERETEAFENEFIHYFENENTFYIDNTLVFPFLKCSTSDNGLVKIYSWLCYEYQFDNGIIGYNGYNSLIQFKTINGEIKARLLSDLIPRPVIHEPDYFERYRTIYALETEYTEVFNLGDNIYIFEGEKIIDTDSKIVSFFTIELQSDDIKEYNAFDFVVLLADSTYRHRDISHFVFFTHEHSNWAIKHQAILNYQKDFINKPYKIEFHISWTDEIIEFIYNSEKKRFNGDYERFNDY